MSEYEAVWTAMREFGKRKIKVGFQGGDEESRITHIWVMTTPNIGLVEQVMDSEPPDNFLDLMEERVERLSRAILDSPSVPDWTTGDGGIGELAWIIEDDGSCRINVELKIARKVYEKSQHAFNPDGTHNGRSSWPWWEKSVEKSV